MLLLREGLDLVWQKCECKIDLTKPRLNHVFVGQGNATNTLQGHEQKFEYERVPKYCTHGKLFGHSVNQCRRLEKENNETKDQMDEARQKPKDNKEKEQNTLK